MGVTAGSVATPAPKVMGRGGAESVLLVARAKCPFYYRNLWELMEVEVDAISFAWPSLREAKPLKQQSDV